MKKQIYSILITILSVFSATSQNIRGVVIDSDDNPIAYATISAHSPVDSSIVNGAITDDQGRFIIESVPSGNYYLSVRFLGYETKTLPNINIGNTNLNLGSIELNPSGALLESVNVTAEKMEVLHKVDRQEFRTDQFQAAAGGTATDAIKNMPGVAMNAEGSISMRGDDGFVLLIDGKAVQGDPSTALDQIPSNAIQSIEVITAPSAKYDPEGKSGIINVKLVKGATDGWNIQAGIKYGLPSIEDYDAAKTAARYGGDLTMNYKTKAWDVSLGASLLRNDISGRREGDSVWTLTPAGKYTFLPSDGERSFDAKNITGRMSLGYNPSKSSSYSLGVFVGSRYKERLADINYNNLAYSDYPESPAELNKFSYRNDNHRVRNGDFALGSFEYKHVFKDKSALKTSFLYEYTLLGGPTNNYNYIQGVSLGGAQVSDNDTLQDQFNTNDNPLYGTRFLLDYVKPLADGTLEMGYQFRNLDHQGDFTYQTRVIGTNRWISDTAFSATVNLTRQIHSGYVMYSGKSKNLTYNFGGRLENMERELELKNINTDEKLTYDFLKFYPSAYLQYQLNDAHSLKIAYSKRVKRTTTFKMNPFPEREHSETMEQGDKKLLPEFVDLVELGWNGDLGEASTTFATLYYRYTENLINRVNTIFNDTILNRIYSNVGRAQTLGLEVGLNLKLTPKWEVYIGGNIYTNDIKGEFTFTPVFEEAVSTIPINSSSTIYSYNVNSTYNFSKTTSLQWTLNYLSERNTAQGEDSRFYSPNLTFRKTFLHGKLTGTIQWLMMDFGLLDTNEQRITTWRENQFYTTTNYVYEVDMILLNLTYFFNQSNRKVKFIKSEFGDSEF